MKKKFISILAAFAVLVSFSACQSQQSTELIDSVTTVVEETAEMKTIEPPEEGWTVDGLMQTICFNGHKIIKPFTVESLGENFDIDENETVAYDDGTVGVLLTYKGEPLLVLTYSGIFGNDIENIKIREIENFSLYSNQGKYNDIITINGISTNSSIDDIKNALGKSDIIDGNNFVYLDRDTEQQCAVFWINENDTIDSFFIFLK